MGASVVHPRYPSIDDTAAWADIVHRYETAEPIEARFASGLTPDQLEYAQTVCPTAEMRLELLVDLTRWAAWACRVYLETGSVRLRQFAAVRPLRGSFHASCVRRRSGAICPRRTSRGGGRGRGSDYAGIRGGAGQRAAKTLRAQG